MIDSFEELTAYESLEIHDAIVELHRTIFDEPLKLTAKKTSNFPFKLDSGKTIPVTLEHGSSKAKVNIDKKLKEIIGVNDRRAFFKIMDKVKEQFQGDNWDKEKYLMTLKVQVEYWYTSILRREGRII